MKILKLVFNQIHQGTYWRAYNFGKCLANRGHEVTLVATSRKSRWRISEQTHGNFTLVEMPDLFSGSLRSGWDPWNCLRRCLWLSHKSFDLVHAYESRPTVIFPALYAQSKGAKLIMDWADWFGKGGSVEERNSRFIRAIVRPVESFFEERFRTCANASTVICSVLKEKAIRLGVRKETMLLLPNGTSPEQWHYQEVNEARDALEVPLNNFTIGYVGTIFPQDAAFMAQAFDIVASQIPEARLLLVGYNKTNFKEISRFPERIYSTGYLLKQEEVYAHLAACNVLWLPLQDSNANRGRLPYKLMDYMVVGRPVIATSVGDVVTILQEESFGLLSPVDPTIFAAKTLEISQDQELQNRFGLSARSAAVGRYRWVNLVDSLENLYRQVLSQ